MDCRDLSISVWKMGQQQQDSRSGLADSNSLHSVAIAVALGAIPLLSWCQGSIVTSLRKPAGVSYPHHYATLEQCKANVRLP